MALAESKPFTSTSYYRVSKEITGFEQDILLFRFKVGDFWEVSSGGNAANLLPVPPSLERVEEIKFLYPETYMVNLGIVKLDIDYPGLALHDVLYTVKGILFVAVKEEFIGNWWFKPKDSPDLHVEWPETFSDLIKEKPGCDHQWVKTPGFMFNAFYEDCRLCGAKKEDA